MSSGAQAVDEGGSEFFDSLRKGFLLGAAVLLVALPPKLISTRPAPAAGAVFAPAATAPAPAVPRAPRLADFGSEEPSPDARHVANWAFHAGDNGPRSVVIVDKKMAKVYVFNPQGQLQAATPALLGAAIGDDSAPGIGDKPLAQVLPEEKTTPAGRFIAERGMNTNGEDVVWVDYNAAVSMHRIRPTVAAERRIERMASPTHEDNRISFGCINLPVAFYEKVLSPAVRTTGAVIYVLPETRTPQQVFASYDVPTAVKVAQK
jgi:hypothetical protein